jgi:vitamin B12 transporter
MRATFPLSVAGFTGLLFFANVVYADDNATSDNVVISATRTPTPESQVASSMTVITGDDIAAKGARTLPDILKYVPGLNLVQTGGPAGQTSLFMRGTNSNHTKVLVDGIDVSDPSNPNDTFDFGQFLTQDIDRIEILRGPQSGLYGSDAIGGVINIITAGGSGPLEVKGMAEGGSFDTFNQEAGLNGQADNFHYDANVGHFHSGSVPVTPLDLLPPGEGRNNDYYDNLSAFTKLGYDISDGLDVGLVARYTNTHYRFTGEDYDPVTFLGVPAAQQSESNTAEVFARGTIHAILLDGFFEQTLGFAYTRNRTQNLAPFSSETLDIGERTKLDWQATLRVTEDEKVVLGAEHEREEVSQPLAASTLINSGYAELQSQFTQNLFSALNVRYDSNDRFGGKTTYRVAPTYLIAATGTQVKASLGTGFKAPTLSELFQDFPPFFFANSHLKPESSTGWDAGFEQPLLSGEVRVGITYFHESIRNLIVTALSGITYANVGRATTEGVESFISYQPVQSFLIRADYTYTEANDDILHEELLRRPKHEITVDANWHATQALMFDATLLTVSSWIDGNRDFSIPRLDANGYTTLALSASYDITSKLGVFVRATNLFDRHFENPVGFLQPSIGVFAGVNAKL